MWLSALEDQLRGPLALCLPGGSTEVTLHEQGLSKSAHALLMSVAFQNAALCFSENEWTGLVPTKRAQCRAVMPEKCGAVLPLDIQVESLLGCPIFLIWWTSHSLCLKPQRETLSLVCFESILKTEKEDFILLFSLWLHLEVCGFPHSSVGKKSACNTEDPSSIPGSGRSAGEGIGYPLQYSWASLVAQLVKNLPAMQET